MVISVTQNVTIATVLPAKATVILASKQALLAPRAGKNFRLQMNLILASRVLKQSGVNYVFNTASWQKMFTNIFAGFLDSVQNAAKYAWQLKHEFVKFWQNNRKCMLYC